MTQSAVVAVPTASGGGHCATPPAPGFDINALDLERLDCINRLVAKAIGSWNVTERVRRLALPSLLYSEFDLQHMRFLMLDGEGGEGVAVAAWEEASIDSGVGRARSVQLHGLYVLPRWQRQGIGADLLEFVCLWARMRDIANVTVRAWRESEAFFRRFGFKPLSQHPSSEFAVPLLWRSSRWTH